MIIRKSDFVCDEHWRVHKLVMQISGCRYYRSHEISSLELLVFYSINLNDCRFVIHYGPEVGTRLYVEFAGDDSRYAAIINYLRGQLFVEVDNPQQKEV